MWFGNLNRDLRIAPVTPADSLFRDGETSVPFIVETTGGGGANSACAAAALGAKVAFLGKVGCDSLGLRLEEALQRQGIATHLKHDPATTTGTSINLVYNSGHRHFISCLPNNESLAFEDLDLSVSAGLHPPVPRRCLCSPKRCCTEGTCGYSRRLAIQASPHPSISTGIRDGASLL